MSDGRGADGGMRKTKTQKTPNGRVPKRVMEKRRRKRINSSLEAMRLLVLEATDDEKLKNPKVEKAEILESVVHFLEAMIMADGGPRAAVRPVALDPGSHRAPQRSFHAARRSCMPRSDQFLVSRSQDSKENAAHSSYRLPGPRAPTSPPPLLRASLMAPPAGTAAAAAAAALLPPHGPALHQLPQPYLGGSFYPPMPPAPIAPLQAADNFWRAWPQ